MNDRVDAYFERLRGKRAVVLGIGVSNRPLVELLARNGVKVIACDRKERAALGGAAAHYEALGAVLHLGEGYLRDLDADVVFRTPGMRPDVPELLEKALRLYQGRAFWDGTGDLDEAFLEDEDTVYPVTAAASSLTR